MSTPYKTRAKKVIEQLRNNEWKFEYNHLTRSCCTARRGSIELWCENGPFYTDFYPGVPNYFGLFYRHWVWWAGIRPLLLKANKKYRQQKIINKLDRFDNEIFNDLI
jgi:hypothetical protein